jgi:hypothetical protein
VRALRPTARATAPWVGAHELPLARFASALSPRLAALAAAAPHSMSLRRALAAWVLVH